jgi:hypothetical protein
MKLWQLRKLSTNANLNDPQPLPENWGPIFGLSGFIDKIGDLSWLGSAYADQGWVMVGDAPDEPAQSTEADIAWSRAKQMLQESDWSMLPDVPMTAGEKDGWVAYRQSLRNIRLQPDFPSNVQWPKAPE